MTHAELQSLLGAYALQALGAGERRNLRAHLPQCRACRAELAGLEAGLAVLAGGLEAGDAERQWGAARRARMLQSLPPLAGPRLTRVGPGCRVDGAPVAGPMELAEGALLSAPKGSKVEIQLPGRAVALLMDGLRARMRRVKDVWELKLEQGQAMIQVRPGQAFQTWLPMARIAVRGTYYYVNVSGPSQGYVCLCEGVIDLSCPGQRRRLEATDRHVAVELRRVGRATRVSPTIRRHGHPDLGPIGRG